MNGQRHRKQKVTSQDQINNSLQLPTSSGTSPISNAKHRRKKATRRYNLHHILVLIIVLCVAGPSFYFFYKLDNAGNEPHAQSNHDGQSHSAEADNQNQTLSKERRQSNMNPAPLLSAPSGDVAIPNILTFTHYMNLLETNLTQTTTNVSVEERDELFVLQQNVRNIIALHPTAHVRFLTDQDCRRSISNVFRQIYNNASNFANESIGATPSLVDYFDKEPAGMYKADLCRGAALWEKGGLYFDVDLGVRMNVHEVLKQTQKARKQHATNFCTVRVHKQSKRPGAFFQAFIGVTPRHAIIQRYVELFWEYYQGLLPEYKNEPLGVVLLRRAMDDVLRQNPNATETIELWQEVLYHPKMKPRLEKIVPYPTWGLRRACKFIVVSSVKEPFTVPFYSRIAGSRMCPVADTAKDNDASNTED